MPDHIVISEFRTRGQNGAGDEFIEIFNPSGQAVDIGGWQIKKSSGCGISTTILLTVSSGVQLAAGQHFLAAPSGASAGPPDQNFTAGIADSGGIALLDSQGSVIDSAGMCADTAYLEEDPLLPLASGSLDQSYERRPGGCTDSNNNLADFTLTVPSDPQNLSSPFTICTDTSTATATTSATPTASATETPTVTPSFTDTPTRAPGFTPSATLTRPPTAAPTSQILISEFRTRGQNGAGDEFIEIFNPTGETVEIGGWLLKRSSGCGTSVSTLLTISAGIQLLPGQHFLAAPSGASINTPDQNFTAGIADSGGIALLNNSGIIIDQAGMCAATTYLEGTPLAALTSSSLDRSYERASGGCTDTDNNIADFTLIGPGAPQNLSSPLNVCADVPSTTPTFTPSAAATATDTPTAAGTTTFTPTPTITATATPSATATPTFTPSATATATATPSATATPTFTPSATATATPSATATPTFTPSATATITAIDTPSATATTTATDTPTVTATPTSTPSATTTTTATGTVFIDHILISEFRTRGQNGAGDEFIEVFNPTNETVDISGWSIKRSSGCGISTATLLTVTNGIHLSPGQHFLAAPSAASVSSPDQNFTAGIADNGGIALLDSQANVIDRAGMCADTAYFESIPLPPLSSSVLDRSYERNSGGCDDTNNNLADFSLIVPSNPQNLSSAMTACGDISTATPIPSATDTPTATATETPTATALHTPSPTATLPSTPIPPNHILISEFRTRGPSGASDELIEIFNPTGNTIDISGWLIRKSSLCGAATSTLLTVASGVQLSPGQHFLAAPSGASAANADQNFSAGIADTGGIALVDGLGMIMDQAGMCASSAYLEGDPLPGLTASSLDRSYERNSSGCLDTDNNLIDFSLIAPSSPQNLSSPLTACASGTIEPFIRGGITRIQME
ncbi:lamin tail domain-containing protein [Candidatus Villigracilis saccharophilus]|uniref:lamin tail domain-containing protein n=1 Tax=Candidatus Villigracilis saccharophilus TaxID=3140684 RepID=UPI0031E5C6FB